MEKNVNTILNVCYYTFYVLAVAVALLFWYLIVHSQQLSAIDPQTTAGQVFQYVVISYTILSVAGGLYLFKRRMDKVRLLEDKALQLAEYRTWGIVRICLIGAGVPLGIIAFYWLGGYNSMIWCAAVSTIGLYFCKPTLRKMELELSNIENTNQ